MGTDTDMDMATEKKLRREVSLLAALQSAALSHNSLMHAEAHDGTRLSLGGCVVPHAVPLASSVNPATSIAGWRRRTSAHRRQRLGHHSTGHPVARSVP